MKIFFYLKRIIPARFKPQFKRLESTLYFCLAMGFDINKWLLYTRLVGAPRYLYMQRIIYEHQASKSKYESESDIKNEQVVGNYAAHNDWPDYDLFLMKYVDNSFKKKIGVDFGCGPGRCIVKYNDRFLRIDGIDISRANINNAKVNISKAGLPVSNFYLSSGDDLGGMPDNHCDFVFSTIAMQHICVYEVRLNILRCMYKALKPGGRISIQMAMGSKTSRQLGSVGYYENYYNALSTNSQHDCYIENSTQIESDLSLIGFKNFEFWIRPGGPGCVEGGNWIYFTAVKQ
jgi:SAM-dependent methyltransferase